MRRLLKPMVAVILVAALVPSLAGCAPEAAKAPSTEEATTEAQLPKVELNMHAIAGPPSPFYTYVYEKSAQDIEDVTNGRADITIYPSCALLKRPDAYQGFIEGIADVGLIWPMHTPGAFPIWDLFMLPGLMPNQATSNVVLQQLLKTYPQFEKVISPKLKFITGEVHMRADLHSVRPMRSINDIKGKLIGCQDENSARALNLLGASAMQMSPGDMYISAERGVVDGVVCAWGTVNNTHLYEVCPYHTLIAICPTCSWPMFNRVAWDKFTPAEQRSIELLANTLQTNVVVGNVEASMEVRELVKGMAGQEMIEWSKEDIDAMRERFRPLWNDWAENMKAKGVPGEDILKDTERLIDGYVYG